MPYKVSESAGKEQCRTYTAFMHIHRFFPALFLFVLYWPFSASAAGGQLTVAVSAPTQAKITIAKGAQRVPMLSLDLTASCDDDIRITSIGLQHHGMGKASNIRGVYFSDASRRLSRSTTFDRATSLASTRFSNLLIARCDTVHMDLLVDFSPHADAGSEHAIDIVKNMIQSSAAGVTVTQDTTKQTIALSPVSAPILEMSFLGSPSRVSFGLYRTVARLQIRNVSSDAIEIKKLTLTNNGTARDYDLRSLSLESTKGDHISEVQPHMRAHAVSFFFDPYFRLDRGDTKVLILKADVWGSQLKTMQFVIEENGDVVTQVSNQR